MKKIEWIKMKYKKVRMFTIKDSFSAKYVSIESEKYKRKGEENHTKRR